MMKLNHLRRICIILCGLLIVGQIIADEQAVVETSQENSPQSVDGDNSTAPLEEDFVFILNGKNFDQFIKNNEFVAVMFYAPWCGHCTNMKPFYHEAAKILRQDETIKSDRVIVLAKVDATVEGPLSDKHEVEGYPTLFVFRNGAKYEYEGPRGEGKDIVNYLVKVASNDWKPPVSKVHVLTIGNFSQFVEKHEISMVAFISPTCGFCKHLAPNYEKAAKILANESDPIPLAKVDATVELELSQKFKIPGYPTIFIFRKGRHYEYNGGRELKDIVKFMKQTRLGATTEVHTLNGFTSNVLKPTDLYVLGLFEGKETPAFELFTQFTAKYSEDMKFYHTFNSNEIINELRKISSQSVPVPSLIVYYHDLSLLKKEPKFKVLSLVENPSVQSMENFAIKESLPTVNHLSSKNVMLIYNKIRPICYVIYDIDIELRPFLNNLRDKVGHLAKKHKEIVFALVNETDNTDFVKDFRLQEYDNEITLACLNSQSKVFLHRCEDDNLDVDEVSEFVEKFIAGQLRPFVKSEKVPKQSPNALVKTVVGETFDELITKNDKDVFLTFVGSSLRGVYDYELTFAKVAKLYASNKNLYFARIDKLKNDFPNTYQPLNSRPTLYFVPKEDKKPVLFRDNEASFENMQKFFEANLNKDSQQQQQQQQQQQEPKKEL